MGSLEEVVKKIPDKAYKTLPSLAKLILLVEAKLFDALVKGNRNAEALALLRVVEVELKLILKDSYVVNSAQLTKVQVMQRIDIIRSSLKLRK